MLLLSLLRIYDYGPLHECEIDEKTSLSNTRD